MDEEDTSDLNEMLDIANEMENMLEKVDKCRIDISALLIQALMTYNPESKQYYIEEALYTLEGEDRVEEIKSSCNINWKSGENPNA